MCKHLLIGAILLLVLGLCQLDAIAGESSGIDGERSCAASDNVASVHHQWLGAIEEEPHKRLAEVIMESLAQSTEPSEATRRPKPYGFNARAHQTVLVMRRALVSFPSVGKIPEPSEEDAHPGVGRRV